MKIKIRITESKEKILGGLGSKLHGSMKQKHQEIADKHGVSLQDIEDQLEMGLKIEMEHTTDKAIAHEIAMDHLMEDPHYYTNLSKIEEVYELSDEDREFAIRMNIDPDYSGDSIYNASARALGLQSKEQIIKDRNALKSYQYKLNSTTDGKKLIQQFVNGKDVTIMHAINYHGYASMKGVKPKNRVDKEKPFQRWLDKYGRKGKDVLSTVASDSPLGTSIYPGWQNKQAAQGFGFIMKGYPVYISYSDVMSQTLGALPAGLIKHQASSGVAKRPGENLDDAILGPDFNWAGEVLLDNWTVIGTYMDISRNNSLEIFVNLVHDSMNMSNPLPMYVYDDGNFVGAIKDKESYIEVRKKLFGF